MLRRLFIGAIVAGFVLAAPAMAGAQTDDYPPPVLGIDDEVAGIVVDPPAVTEPAPAPAAAVPAEAPPALPVTGNDIGVPLTAAGIAIALGAAALLLAGRRRAAALA